jgi:hypothetical protein
MSAYANFLSTTWARSFAKACSTQLEESQWAYQMTIDNAQTADLRRGKSKELLACSEHNAIECKST